ncbi:LPXTG cell wall anchor domain-containing protein, partial [Streptococcus sp. HMSC034E03]
RSDADKNEPKSETKDPAITPVVNPSTKKAGAKELPNTGTEQSNASLGLALLVAATAGLLFAKKRKEEE